MLTTGAMIDVLCNGLFFFLTYLEYQEDFAGKKCCGVSFIGLHQLLCTGNC